MQIRFMGRKSFILEIAQFLNKFNLSFGIKDNEDSTARLYVNIQDDQLKDLLLKLKDEVNKYGDT